MKCGECGGGRINEWNKRVCVDGLKRTCAKAKRRRRCDCCLTFFDWPLIRNEETNQTTTTTTVHDTHSHSLFVRTNEKWVEERIKESDMKPTNDSWKGTTKNEMRPRNRREKAHTLFFCFLCLYSSFQQPSTNLYHFFHLSFIVCLKPASEQPARQRKREK